MDPRRRHQVHLATRFTRRSFYYHRPQAPIPPAHRHPESMVHSIKPRQPFTRRCTHRVRQRLRSHLGRCIRRRPALWMPTMPLPPRGSIHLPVGLMTICTGRRRCRLGPTRPRGRVTVDPWARVDGLSNNKTHILITLITSNLHKQRGMRTRTNLIRLPRISSTVIPLSITSKSIVALKYLFFPVFYTLSYCRCCLSLCWSDGNACCLALTGCCASWMIVSFVFSSSLWFRFLAFILFFSVSLLHDYTPPNLMGLNAPAFWYTPTI